MKPHLLMLLLLAIPPLVANILACENAATTDAPTAAKSDSVTREIPAPAAHRALPNPSPTPPSASLIAPGAKSVAPSGAGTSKGLKAWFVM